MIRNLVLWLFLAGCSASKSVIPLWLHQKLLQAERNQNYVEVWSYDYKKQRVYYFIPICCDRFTELYDAEGRLVCHPAGGITGRGDGKCLRFLEGRKNGELIWRPQGAIME